MKVKRRGSFKINAGAGFLDEDRRLRKLEELGDPLVSLGTLIDWELFRILCSQHRCCATFGQALSAAAHKPEAPSAMSRCGAQRLAGEIGKEIAPPRLTLTD